MTATFSTKNFHQLNDQLAAGDPDLAGIIKRHGYPPMWSRPNTFETLVHIILEQQVSLASALAAVNKLRERLQTITPENVLTLSDEEMKGCYCSRQKSGYIRTLADKLIHGELDLTALNKLSDEEVSTQLMNLKGIGRWTADIYLIFVLQRTDVFPMGDLAAISALRKIKGLDRTVTKEMLISITHQWKPYRTIATMLLWHEYLSAPGLTKKTVFPLAQ